MPSGKLLCSMAPPFNQWLRRKFRSSNHEGARGDDESGYDEILQPPPFRDEWPMIPACTTGYLVQPGYGPFQHLPLEIRQQILGHAFGNRTLHVDLTFDHPLIRRPGDSRHKQAVKSALASHLARPNASSGIPHCGFGAHLTRDTRKPKQWQWFSCVCHRHVVRAEGDDEPSGRKPRIEPHEDGCIPGERVGKRAGHSPRAPTLCRCESTEDSPTSADACFIGVMGWLLACRQAYCDGTDILYRTNTFHISSLPLLLDLPRLMPPHHLAVITSAELLWTFTNPDLLNDETMAQLWQNYTQAPRISTLPDRSSPTTSPSSHPEPTHPTKLHRLSAQLPAALPSVRRLYIALQAHLPPPQPAALPPPTYTNTNTNTGTDTPTPTTTATHPNPNPNPHNGTDTTPILTAIEHAVLSPIETAFRRLGLRPDKEFSLAVQRGGWEVLADWLERRREPGRGGVVGRRVFEVFGDEGGGGGGSYRERVWKPLSVSVVGGEDGEDGDGAGYWLCQGWDDFEVFGAEYWMFDLWGTGVGR